MLFAASISRNTHPPSSGRHDRPRDRRAHRSYAWVRARESSPWHAATPRASRPQSRRFRLAGIERTIMNKPRNNSSEEPIMNAPYLWDGSGEPDPEVQRLESLLAQFSHRDIPFTLPLPQDRKSVV